MPPKLKNFFLNSRIFSKLKNSPNSFVGDVQKPVKKEDIISLAKVTYSSQYSRQSLYSFQMFFLKLAYALMGRGIIVINATVNAYIQTIIIIFSYNPKCIAL